MWEKWAEKNCPQVNVKGFIEVEEVEAAFSEETAEGRALRNWKRLGIEGNCWCQTGDGEVAGLLQEGEAGV